MAALAFSSLVRCASLSCKRYGYRTYLSAAYRCQEHWNKRHEEKLVKEILLEEYLMQLDRKYKAEGKVSAIDVDLFVSALSHESIPNYVEDLEEVINQLRRSPETVNTLPSTHHTVLRTLLESGHTDSILMMISDPLNYGIFADHFVANMMMDAFLEQENYTAAARVASTLMLQEDFGSPLTQSLALLSCYCYATTSDNIPWTDYRPKADEPEEEVKIRLPFLRNPYFDDHFDLAEPKHIVGKTLAWLAPLIKGPLGSNCELLGWAMYEKWASFQEAVQRVLDSEDSVGVSLFPFIEECVEKMEDDMEKKTVTEALQKLKSSKCTSDLNLDEMSVGLVKEQIEKYEKQEIQKQEEVYNMWAVRREEEVSKQIWEYEKKRLLAEVEAKKKELEEREEHLYFFDNKEKLEFMLKKKEEADTAMLEKLKKRGYIDPEKAEKQYIPPEVIKRR